uniref:Transmembrane protein 216-like n=1 Tax=Phallusia mammillata TaxID=59560 RepID=A0A6F9DUH1_9ASCI|nr:transmembrane protein 216-like [Phallusia mammillata]
MRGYSSKPVLSSLPLQIFYELNSYYFGLFFVAEILLFVYKAEMLYYPSQTLGIDLGLLFVLTFLEMLRLFVGCKGNLTERTLTSLFSVFLLAVSAALVVYFLLWQTFVLRIDLVLCGILLFLHLLQFVFSLIATISFISSSEV